MNLKYYKDRRGNWRWELTSRGKVVGASTEGFATKAKAAANFERIVTKGASAKVEVIEPAAKKPAKKAVRKKAAPVSLPAPSYDGF